MERHQEEKRMRVAFNPRKKPTPAEFHNVLKRIRKLMDKQDRGHTRARARPVREMSKKRTKFKETEVPEFTTYEEYQKTEHPRDIQPCVLVVDSDDETPVKPCRLEKGCQQNDVQRMCQVEASNMDHPDSDTDVKFAEVRPATWEVLHETIQYCASSQSSQSTNMKENTSKSTRTNSVQDSKMDSMNIVKPVNMEIRVCPEVFSNDSQERGGSPQHEDKARAQNKTVVETKNSNSKEDFNDEIIVISNSSYDEDFCDLIEDTKEKKRVKTQEIDVDHGHGHGQEKSTQTTQSITYTQQKLEHPAAVVGPIVTIDQSASGETEPRRILPQQRLPLRERIVQQGTSRIGIEDNDLIITRFFPDTNTEQEEREQQRYVYELSHPVEIPYRLPYESQQFRQGQENLEYQPPEQMATVINDLERGPINCYANYYSENAQLQTYRLWEDPVDCIPPLVPQPSARSHQAMTVPYQPLTVPHHPLATLGYPPATSHYPSRRPQDPPIWPHHASYGYRSENTLRPWHPGEENPAYFLIAQSVVNLHP